MEPHVNWVWGRRPVEELLRSAKPVLRVWFSPRLPPTSRKDIVELCRTRGIDCRHAPDAKLASLTGSSEHGGAVAQPSPTSLESLDDLLTLPPAERKVVFALDGVENPRNLGLVARVLVAAGCGTVVLPAKGGALPGQVFLEASAGYGTRLRIVRVPKLVPALEALKRDGYWVYGLAAGAPRGLFGHELAERTVFVLGNESDGIRPTVRAVLDESLSIPVADGVDSLNVAVTAALCAFEAVRAGRTSSSAGPSPTGGRSAVSPRRAAKEGIPPPRG
jgi:23S rRNA (guanosine2251-2'-O)-methyltransferase